MKKLYLLFNLLFFLAYQNVFSRELIIAGIPEEPNRWIDTSGKVVGLDVDIIDYIMKELGIKYKIVIESSSARLDSLAQKDKPSYDMIFTYSKNSDRERYLYYPNESHITFSWNFFVLKENRDKFKFNSYSDLKGAKIGITKGFSYSEDFLNAIKKENLNVDEIVKNELQITKLLQKRIDMVPLNTKATLYEAKREGIDNQISYLPKPIVSKTYYNTFVKKSDYPNIDVIRFQYDEVLKRMKKDGTLKKILSKYGMDE